jgi:hypothetical protein
MSDEQTIDLKKFNINFANPNEVIKLISEMETKINTMRTVLWEWNCSSGPVWEYYRLKAVGEKAEDYGFAEDGPGSFDEYESTEE